MVHLSPCDRLSNTIDSKEYLQLVDLTNAIVSSTFMFEVRKVAKGTPDLACKRAVVGVNSQGKKILLKAYNLVLRSSGLKPFNTMKEAKDWLVED